MIGLLDRSRGGGARGGRLFGFVEHALAQKRRGDAALEHAELEILHGVHVAVAHALDEAAAVRFEPRRCRLPAALHRRHHHANLFKIR